MIITTARRLAQEIPEGTEKILLYGKRCWGKGKTLEEAREAFRSEGFGRLSDGYIVYCFPAGVTTLYVDGLGSVIWEWEEGQPEIQPLAVFGVRGKHTTF